MNLEDVKAAFPIGAEVSFHCDDGGETEYEWREIGIVQEYTPFYFGKEILGYFEIKVYNRETKKFHKAHVHNTKLTEEYIRNEALSLLLDE